MGSLVTAVDEAGYSATPAQTNYSDSGNALSNNDTLAQQMQGIQQNAANRGAPQSMVTELNPATTYNAAQGTAGNSIQSASNNTQIAPSATKYLQQMNAPGGVNQTLTNTMNGTGPSVAANQLAQGEQQQVANQMAVLGSTRGGNNNALAARTAANQSAAGVNALQQQQANARIAESTAAAGQLSNNLTNASGQQIGLDTNAAQLAQNNNQFNATSAAANNQFNATQNQNASFANAAAQNTAQASNAAALNAANLQQGSMNQLTGSQNVNAELQSTGLSDQQIDAMLAGQTGIDQTAINENLAQNAQAIGEQTGLNSANEQAKIGSANASGQGVNDGIMAMAMSDENVKTGISGGNAMLASFLKSLQDQGAKDATAPIAQQAVPQQTSAAPAAMSKANLQSIAKSFQSDPGAASNFTDNPTSSDASSTSQLAGGGVGAAGGGGLLTSDEDEKKDVSLSADDLQGMLDHLKAYQYRYKDDSMPGAGPGRRVGVMAQDLEKSPYGASMVEETPNGKAIDINKAVSAALASAAYLNERVDDIERKKKGARG